jgi:bacterial/archaeal transporter family protein
MTGRPAPGFPPWLAFSIATIVLWGAWGVQSKLIVDRISPWMNQALFPLGLLPALLFLTISRNMRRGSNLLRGSGYAFLTGILGGVGNIAFYLALARGGKAAIVVPMTCVFPLVTVILAAVVLNETMSRIQTLGLVLAFLSIYLLSV